MTDRHADLARALATGAEPLEVARRAARLARHDRGDPLLDALPPIDRDDLVDAVARAAEAVAGHGADDPGDPAWSALVEIHDLLDAADLLDAWDDAAPYVDDAVAAVQAFPEGWVQLAERAGARLTSPDAPPRGSPAWSLFAAVEASPTGWEEPAADAPFAVLLAAGLVPELTLRLAARGGPFRMPGWEQLAAGDDWALISTEDQVGPMFLFLGDPPDRVTCDGAPAPLTPHAEGCFCRPSPGRWRVETARGAFEFVVRP